MNRRRMSIGELAEAYGSYYRAKYEFDLQQANLGLIRIPQKIAEAAKSQQASGNERQNADAIRLYDLLSNEGDIVEKKLEDKKLGAGDRSILEKRRARITDGMKVVFSFHPMGGETARHLQELSKIQDKVSEAYGKGEAARISEIEEMRTEHVEALREHCRSNAGMAEGAGRSLKQVYSAYALGYLGAIEQSANSEIRNGTYSGELGKKEVEDRRKALDEIGDLQLGLMEAAGGMPEIREFRHARGDYEPGEITDKLREEREKETALTDEGLISTRLMREAKVEIRPEELTKRIEEMENFKSKLGDSLSYLESVCDRIEKASGASDMSRLKNLKLEAKKHAADVIGEGATGEQKRDVREKIEMGGAGLFERLAENEAVKSRIAEHVKSELERYKKIFGK